MKFKFLLLIHFIGFNLILKGQISGHLAQYNFSGNANDSKGTNHGTVSNATLTTDRFGVSNSAYAFSSSSSSYVQIPYSNFFVPNYSYSIWVKPTSIPSTGNSVILVSIGGNGGDQNLQIENTRNYGGSIGVIHGFSLTGYQKSGSTVAVGGTCTGTLPNTNQWYHVVVTRDSNYYKIYVDGCLKVTSASTSGALPFYGNNNFDARIGCRERGSFFSDAVIDEVGIYNRALKAEEVTKLYNNLKPLKISKDTTICKDDFQQFKLKAPRTYCTYRWVNMASPSSVLGTDSHLLINITSTATFRCITNSKDTAYAKVTIIQRPIVKLGNDTFYCGKLLRTLDAGPKARSYLWNDNSSSRYRTVNDSGKFHVLYTDSFGCKARDTIWLRIHPLPKFNLGPDTHYCNTFNRTLSAIPNVSKYTWNTNDTTSSIAVNQKGLFWVEAKDSNNCFFRDSILIDNPKTAAGFTVKTLDSCLNTNRFVFQDTSWLEANYKVSSTFYFKDNTSSSLDSLLKIYNQPGVYNVQLKILTNKNCIDSAFKTIRVWPNAQKGFTINQSEQCDSNHKFIFTNTSSINSGQLSYNWNFGDGTNDTSKNISSKSYSLDSTYSVRLITKSNQNCYDTLSKSVTVFPNSHLSYSIDKFTQCFNNNSLNIANSSYIRTGSVIKQYWHFSNSTIDSTHNIINKKFSQPDTLSVLLETISDKGCRDSLIKDFIIHPNTVVGFNINKDTQCFKWNSFNFNDASSLAYGTYSSSWKFGDGNTSDLRNIAGKKYNLFGTYNVFLETTTSAGCKDSLVKSITVHSSPVDTFFVPSDRQCFRGNVFNFINKTTIPSGNIANRVWNLDDGNTFTSVDVLNHKYLTEDSFYVTLSSTSNLGCKDTFRHLAVTFAQPIAVYNIPNDSQCWQKNYFNINNQSKIKYGTMSHNWDFGDYTSDTSYTPATKKYANKSASYMVRYKVLSDHGCGDSLNHRIHLLERPIADFSINDSIQCFRGHLFTFANKTTFSAINTVSYYWDYGNGDTSIGILPKTSTYLTPNYHNVSLIAYSYLTNCYDTTVYRVLPAPHSVPDFNINKDSQCLRTNRFVFTNQSSVSFGQLKYLWTYNDGTFDTLIHPVKIYSSGFMRNVKLKVTTNNNCSDSITKPVVIIPHPIARFAINDTAQCLNKQGFDFTNQSTTSYGPFTSKWMFDDGIESTSKDYSNKQFKVSAYHLVKLAVYSYQGCPDTVSRVVFLEKNLNTYITQTRLDSQCLKGNLFQFTSGSNNPDVSFVSQRWEFGDAGQSSLSNPTHSYASEGHKIVLLETTSLNGCLDTARYNVVVHPQAILSFTTNSPCFPDSVKLTNTSSISVGTISSYKFEMTDGFQSTLINPSHKFTTAGTYGVKLTTISDKGCKDTLDKPGSIIVRVKPNALFTQERLPDKQFDVATIKFTNASSNDVTLYNWNFGNGNTSTEENPEADFNDTFRKLVTLIVTNNVGCTDTFSARTGSLVSDFVFYMPDAFSPGTNGVNDVLKPVMTPYVRKYVMEVFNRWGERVFYSDDLTKGWDGTYNGEDCEQGVYICRIYLVPMRGAIRSENLSITLLR